MVCDRAPVAHVAVVVEALLQRRTDGQVNAVLQLQGLAKHVRRRVPEGLQLFKDYYAMFQLLQASAGCCPAACGKCGC